MLNIEALDQGYGMAARTEQGDEHTGGHMNRSEEIIETAIKLIKPYYVNNPSGGSLHIVLDDGNTEDSNLDFCILYALEEGDYSAVVIGGFLLAMTEDEREELYERYSEYCG